MANTNQSQAADSVKGSRFLYLALIVLCGMGLEALYAYLLEPLLYGAAMSDWTDTQYLIHWGLTIATWLAIAWLTVRIAEKRLSFSILAAHEAIKPWHWVLVGLSILLAILICWLNWNGFKPLLEYRNLGPKLFIGQYLYYAVETLSFMLIIIFAQKACEIWFHKKNFPYGGIVCGLTWGLAHVFTQSSLLVGILCMLNAFLMGSAYVLLGRDVRKTYVVLLIMFIC